MTEEKTEDSKKCVICGGEVDGECNGVHVTICCVECCEKAKTEQDYYCVAKGNAISRYGCVNDDLAKICCKLSRNPHHKKFLPMRLYLIAEVEYLGKERTRLRQLKKAERDEKLRLQLIKKRQNLLKTIQRTFPELNVMDVDKTLGHFILGDYLKKKSGTRTKRDDVLKRCSVIPRAQHILQFCPDGHPDAVLEFCLTHPGEGVLQFHQLKETLRRVFVLEGTRILQNIPPSELTKLRDSALGVDVAAFESRDSEAILRSCLHRSVSPSTVEAIMSHPACRRRYVRRQEESTTARKLLEFWTEKDHPEKRRERLMKAFARRGVNMPVVCEKCESYIRGETDPDPDELVASADLNLRLIRDAIEPERSRGQTGQWALLRYLNDEKLGYEEAIEKALETAHRERSPSPSYDSSDSYSYDSYRGHNYYFGGRRRYW